MSDCRYFWHSKQYLHIAEKMVIKTKKQEHICPYQFWPIP